MQIVCNIILTMKKLTFLLTSLALLGLTSCGETLNNSVDNNNNNNDNISASVVTDNSSSTSTTIQDLVSDGFTIATTFAPVYDFTMRIVKNKAEVICIVGENEPHGYEPNDTTSVAFTEKADLLLAYGYNMDTWAQGMNSNYQEITTGITFLTTDSGYDPHAWLSLDLACEMMENITTYVSAIDPSNQSYYEANLASAKQDFMELKNEYLEELSDLDSRVIVTSHEAFAYLANDFNLTQKGIADMANNEPSARELAEIITYIKNNNVHTIFVEELDSASYVTTIINTLKKSNYNIEMEELNAYEGVTVSKWSDDDNYLSIMEENLDEIEDALED